MKKHSVLAVVLCYNSSKYIDACIKALYKTGRVDILVIDNASTDETVTTLRNIQTKYKFQLKCQDANLGYAGGNNIGLRYAMKNDYEFAFIVNPDVIPNRLALDELVETLRKNKKIAAASPLITYADKKTIWYAGARIHPDRFEPSIEAYRHPLSSIADRGLREVDSLIGAAMLIRISTLSRVGLMDERYFLYCEETDWSLLFKQEGYTLICNRNAVMLHDVSSSTGGEGSILQIYYYTRNILLLCSKFAPSLLGEQLTFRKKVMYGELKAYFKHPFSYTHLHKAIVMRKAIADFKAGKFGKEKIT